MMIQAYQSGYKGAEEGQRRWSKCILKYEEEGKIREK